MWFGWAESKYINSKPITMKPGSTWNTYNGEATYNYGNYIIEGTESSPAKFSWAAKAADNKYGYYKGTITGGESAFMRWFSTGDSGYGQRRQIDTCVLSNYYGTIRFDGERSIGRALYADWPCSLEVAQNARFEFSGNAVTSTVRRLSVDGSSELRLTTAANNYVIAVTNRLVLADGAVLTINKISAMPYATASSDNVRRYPIFLLSREAYENPETSIGDVTINCGWSMDEIPHGFLYTNVLANGGAEIGWTHIPIVKQTDNGGWEQSVFKDNSTRISELLSDGQPMHGGDYVIGGCNEYPQTKSNPYVCPANCVVFKGQNYSWYNPDIYFTNAVLWAVDSATGIFTSNNGGDYGYTIKGNLKVVPNANGKGWSFRNRRSHMDTLECDISGSGILNFGFKSDVEGDPLYRWYCTYRLFGDNAAFTGTMNFSICADGTYPAFTKAGADPFVQGSHSNIIVWVRKPTAFGGALPEFDPYAVDFGNWTRLMTSNDIAFTELTRGWAFRTNISISVGENATLTLANRIVCSGGGDIVVNAGTAGGRMGYYGGPNSFIKIGGNLVLGGSMTVADGESASTLRMEKGSLQFAATNALAGLNLCFGSAAALKVDPSGADAGFRDRGAVLTGNVSFAGDSKIPVELSSDIELGTTIGVMTVSDAQAGTVLGKLRRPEGAANSPKLSSRVNGDGTTTIVLSTVKVGFIFCVH